MEPNVVREKAKWRVKTALKVLSRDIKGKICLSWRRLLKLGWVRFSQIRREGEYERGEREREGESVLERQKRENGGEEK